MDPDENSKDLVEQHTKALQILSKLPSEEQSIIQPLLQLQLSRNSLYLQFVSELRQLETRYEDQYTPLYSSRAEILKGFHGFWLKSIKNNSLCSSLIYEKDEKILNYLIDIKCTKDPASENFVLEFFFAENPYFENEMLRKKYVMAGEDVMEKGIGTEIRWKDEGSTSEMFPEKESEGDKKDSKKETGSFFKFFSDITMPTPQDLQDMNASIEQELVESVEQDYDIASEFRDEIIPNAVLYFFDARTEVDLDTVLVPN